VDEAPDAGSLQEGALSGERVERRLAAILAADIAGYSRLVGLDEEGTLARLRSLRREVIDPAIAAHRGRIVKTTGDGMLLDFQSVVDAVRYAVAVQSATTEREGALPAERRIAFRVGINLGDIVVEGDDILGDGVNIAARLEGIAEPGGICISAIVHDQVQDRLGCVFEDLGEQSLKNIARPVRVYRVAAKSPLPSPGPQQEASRLEGPAALALPDKPSIAVLAFENLSGDPEQEYFADGMVEEIITALSRFRWLFVIARNSSFTYKGQAVDVKRVGRELGVRYVLEGSVRRAGGRVRITAQLIEAQTATHLWADRFDGSLQDVFELQDQVANNVAGVIEPVLQAAEVSRSVRRPTTDLSAYDLYLRALMSWNAATRESFNEALRLLDQAITRDPAYGPALALAALCIQQLHVNGWAEDPMDAQRLGLDYARRALQPAAPDGFVLASAAYASAYFGEDIDAAIALMDRSLVTNPSSAHHWHMSGVVRMFAGQPDIAIEHLNRGLRLNPRDRPVAPLTAMGVAYMMKRDFDMAVAKLQASEQERPGLPMTYRALAACYAHLGQLDEAREYATRLRAITPIIIPPFLPYRNPEHRDLLLSGLRLALDGPK
jgi:TolB-like protein/class 3 adenylate cyclase